MTAIPKANILLIDDQPANVDVLPVSRLLAETIMNVFCDESVSAIFAGENQLF